jgi:LysR family nod box-dependent transcriptional activator
MELTALGRKMEGPLRELLLHIHTTVGIRASFDPAVEACNFRIMASDYAVEVFLNRVLTRLLREAPNMTLELVPLTEDAGEKLRRGENDFLIIPRLFVSEEHPSEVLFEDRYYGVVSEGNTQVGEQLDLETYKRLGHVAPLLGKPRSPTYEELMLQRAGIRRQIKVATFDFSTMASVLIGTDLVATMHGRLAEACARRLPIRLLPIPVELPTLAECVQWHRFQDNDPCHTWMRTMMLEVAREMAAPLPAA